MLILANPYSGSGPNRRRVGELESHLRGAGLEPEVVWERERHAELLASHADVPLRCLVAAGGDGSIGGILNAMRDADRLGLPFATLPVGNENLFAREFGFERRRPAVIAAAIARGETRPVDLGECNGRVFHLMVSAGFDAEVVRRVDVWRTAPVDGSLRRVNRLRYAVPTLKALARYRYPAVTLEADGGEEEGGGGGGVAVEGSLAFVFNLPQYGGNIAVCGGAEPDDGLLDWVVFKPRGRVQLARFGAMVLARRHQRSGAVVCGRAASVTLRHRGEAAPAQIDGDRLGDTPLNVRVLPAALNVVRMSPRGVM